MRSGCGAETLHIGSPSGGFNISLKHLNTNLMYNKLTEMMRSRQWPRLPSDIMQIDIWEFNTRLVGPRFDWSRFCLQTSQTSSQYVIIDSIESSPRPLDLLSKSSKLTFHFKHPSVTSCSLPGNCGFILKTVPSEKPLWKLRLCTEEEDYNDEPVHFHDLIEAENMHIFYYGVRRLTDIYEYLPLSWLGWIRTEKMRNEWQDKFLFVRDYSCFRVLYRVETSS